MFLFCSSFLHYILLQLINTGSVRQIRNEVDIQSICGHHPFIVECIAYWQNRTQIYIRELKTQKCSRL